MALDRQPEEESMITFRAIVGYFLVPIMKWAFGITPAGVLALRRENESLAIERNEAVTRALLANEAKKSALHKLEASRADKEAAQRRATFYLETLKAVSVSRTHTKAVALARKAPGVLS